MFNCLFVWLSFFLFNRLVFDLLKNASNEIKKKKLLFSSEKVFHSFLTEIFTSTNNEKNFHHFLLLQAETFMEKIILDIPMGDYLLAGATGKKIKAQIKKQTELMVDLIKTWASEKIIDQPKYINFLEEKIESFYLEHLLLPLKKQVFEKIRLYRRIAFGLAIILSLLQSLLLNFFDLNVLSFNVI